MNMFSPYRLSTCFVGDLVRPIYGLLDLKACASTRKDPASRMVQGERKNCIGGKIIDGHLELYILNECRNSLTDVFSMTSRWHSWVPDVIVLNPCRTAQFLKETRTLKRERILHLSIYHDT